MNIKLKDFFLETQRRFKNDTITPLKQDIKVSLWAGSSSPAQTDLLPALLWNHRWPYRCMRQTVGEVSKAPFYFYYWWCHRPHHPLRCHRFHHLHNYHHHHHHRCHLLCRRLNYCWVKREKTETLTSDVENLVGFYWHCCGTGSWRWQLEKKCVYLLQDVMETSLLQQLSLLIVCNWGQLVVLENSRNKSLYKLGLIQLAHKEMLILYIIWVLHSSS